MAAGTQPRSWDQPSRRRRMRHGLRVPLDVTVLRSGIPDTLPGRSLNLGEGGVAAVLAGELLPGEAVGVEIWLPLTQDPLRARALVRHHDKLRSGMEFLGLSAEQQTAIRDCAGAAQTEMEQAVGPRAPDEGEKDPENGGDGGSRAAASARKRSRRGWIFLLVSAAVLIAVLWWHWNRGWQELESGLQKNETRAGSIHPQVQVPAEEMEKLVTHRVDPEYPAAARPENLRGVIVLDVIVGRDGSVVDLHPRNGPEVLSRAAMDALRWWRFQPYRVSGQPVVVETTVAVEFKP